MLFSGFALKQEGIVYFSLNQAAIWSLGIPAYGAVCFYAVLFVSHRLQSLFNDKTIKQLAFVSFQAQNIMLAKKCLLET